MTETATETAAPAGQTNRDRLFIDGRWVDPAGSGRIDVVDPATEEVFGSVPDGSTEDVERAVAAARAAFTAWSETPVEERARLLEAVQKGLGESTEELVQVIAHELGMPVKMSPIFQLASPPFVFGYYADLVRKYTWEEEVGNSLLLREPVGVVAAITPWNYPLHQIALKVAPALAAGCTVVLKPSQVTPLNAFVLAEVIEAAGLPRGVFNLVTGSGRVIGEALAGHPEVDMVSFTGSTSAGKRVQQLASETVKRVALELGGKSANVILDDADLDQAVKLGVRNVTRNSGQSCDAWTRMLVPRDRQEEVVELARKVAESAPVGNPLQADVQVGPVVSRTQRDSIREYINKGIAEGARLVTGGAEAPAGLEKGYYVQPTIFADVRPEMTIAQEEIFGPVLAIIPYDTEDDAVRIANDSIYGLAGAVFSGDPERAKRVAKRIRTGRVDINGGTFNLMAPFGGYKQSGLGRELGTYGIEEFLEVKALQL
jgi:aldehyde dehydrogenase (NAD+)